MTAIQPQGISILLAIRDNALGEAERLEAEAAELEGRAQQRRHEAEALREVHAKAAPYFPVRAA